MKKDTTTIARHFYAQAYADYLRNGNLKEATAKVAYDIFSRRNGAAGSHDADWAQAESITNDWPRTITETSQAHLFDKAMSKTKDWLKQIEYELELSNPNEAYRALRAVLHAIRDRLPVNKTVEFGAQLPILVIGIYYSGWKPNDKPKRIKHVREFLDRVETELPASMDPMRVTQAIIRILERHVTEGAMDGVKKELPVELQEFWAETLRGKGSEAEFVNKGRVS